MAIAAADLVATLHSGFGIEGVITCSAYLQVGMIFYFGSGFESKIFLSGVILKIFVDFVCSDFL